MPSSENYIEVNRQAWNKRTEIHYVSEFYDNDGFVKGRNSLNEIELALLGEVKGKSILHLQCHFGQDSISLARMGAKVVGMDLSDASIEKARELAAICGVDARFICCDLYDLPNHLDETFDMVFTTYGTIGWLPDLKRWATVVSRHLKPGGTFVMADFHPVVWMFDDEFKEIKYPYLNKEVIAEVESGTYTNRQAYLVQEYISWNHGIGELLNALIGEGMVLKEFHEHDYSPYDCFKGTEEFSKGKYRIKALEDKIPMVYSLRMLKST